MNKKNYLNHNYLILLFNSRYKYLKLIALFFTLFYNNVNAQTPVETFTVTEEMSFATHEMNADGFASPLASFNGAIYYAYIDPELKGKVVKKAADGTITEHTVIESVTFNDFHTELSLAVDNDGYIHFVGDMHGHSMRYWKSDNPEDVTSWTFYGNDVANGGISGGAVTYCRFTKDRNGTLFINYRSETTNRDIHGRVKGYVAGAIARYNTGTKRWTSLGSLDYALTNNNGERIEGNDIRDGVYNTKAVVWVEDGIGEIQGRAYQGYKLRMVVDKNNRLHLVWNVGIGKTQVAGAVAPEMTHIMYAYSDDQGDTWHKADGTLLQLPMTPDKADVVYSDLNARFGNAVYITLDDNGNPFILQAEQDSFIIYVFRWTGTEWDRVNYDEETDTWIKDLGFEVGFPGVPYTDFHGVITSFDKPNQGILSRSWDSGATWQEYNINQTYLSRVIDVDYELFYATGDIRFQNQISPNLVKIVTVDFASNDDLTTSPFIPSGTVDYSQGFTSYGEGEDDPSSLAESQNQGTTAQLQGNAWKKVGFNYTITPETVLEFDYRSTTEGEIHGIGLDNNNSLLQGYCNNPHNMIGESVIPYNGTKYGFTVNSILLEDANGNLYRRLRARNHTSETQTFHLDINGGGVVYEGEVPAHSELFFSVPYEGNSTYRLFFTGKTIVKSSSVSSQKLACDIAGLDPLRIFQVHGTEPSLLSYQDFNNYDGSGDWKSYSIPVGQYYTGQVNYLTFVNDHDGGEQNGNSYFRNVRVLDKTPQTISFEPIADGFFGSFDLNASTSSTLPIDFSVVSGSGSFTNGNVFISESTGEVTIEARQEGNGRFLPATPIQQTFIVLKSDQEISFNGVSDKLVSAIPFPVTASANSGLPITSYSIVSGSASVSGNIVTLNGEAGTVVVRAIQEGNENYNEAFADLEIEVLPEDTRREFYKAFAFGANTETSIVYNEPTENYTKVNQNGGNFNYSLAQGYGYTDLGGLDATPNNRNKTSCEIYDQFIGAKGGDIVFRIDVPNGEYRFVAAGGDAAFDSQNTTLKVRDGSDGTEFTLVNNFLSNAKEYYQIGFLDKEVPPCTDVNFKLDINSPTLIVTNEYIEVIQSSNTTGGNLNILELWSVGATDQFIDFDYVGDKVTTSIPFEVNATATSGLPITYSIVSGPASINSNTITLSGTSGKIIVRATQGGDANNNPAYADLEINVLPESTVRNLYKAFAFGANSQTAVVANESSQTYTKVNQNGSNFNYTTSLGYGYTDLNGLDGSPNNRNKVCELYDQFVGVKKSGGGSIIFRVDVPNGDYRFVASGGDAANGNQNTTLKVRDGSTGTQLTLVDNFNAINPSEYYAINFLDKIVTACSGVNVTSESNSPVLTVTNGYLEVEQYSSLSGGALSILEIYEYAEGTASNSRIAGSSLIEKQANHLTIPSIQMYPNPVSDYVNFDLEFEKEASLIIYDSTGKRLFEKEKLRRSERIDISKFKVGMYIAKVVLDGKMFNYKLLVE